MKANNQVNSKRMVVKEKLSFVKRKKTIEIFRQTSNSSTSPSSFTAAFQSSEKLGLFDIIAIGVSCSLNGIYVMIGHAMKYDAGPSLIVSFIFAAITTLLAGFCYSELAVKVPRSGSAYTYIYVTIGEFLAFNMGWNLILVYLIGI
jgi:amino acid permease